MYYYHVNLNFLHLNHFLHLQFHITNKRWHLIFKDQRSHIPLLRHLIHYLHNQLRRLHRPNPTHPILATKMLLLIAPGKCPLLLNSDA